MHALDVLGDPVRRRILELLADGEVAAGDVGRIVQAEFGISQPAVSQQLRVLRESGFATVRAEGTRRLYAIDPAPIAEAAQWFTPFERFWRGPLDALGTELARGARARGRPASTEPASDREPRSSSAPAPHPERAPHAAHAASRRAADPGRTSDPSRTATPGSRSKPDQPPSHGSTDKEH